MADSAQQLGDPESESFLLVEPATEVQPWLEINDSRKNHVGRLDPIAAQKRGRPIAIY